MKIENLTKTQIVLLTLLVSFVTSIATGIVTVSLVDQAPPGVTRTINRVVERTVEKVVPGQKASVVTKETTVVVKEEDLIIEAVDKNSRNIVVFKNNEEQVGIGFLASQDGLVVTDSTVVPPPENSTLVLANGNEFEYVTAKTDESSGLSLVRIISPEEEGSQTKFSRSSFGDVENLKLGQTIIALGGIEERLVSNGIISKINRVEFQTEKTEEDTSQEASTSESTDTEEKDGENDETTSDEPKKLVVDSIITNISITEDYAGGPLLNIDGAVIGINLNHQGKTYTLPSSKILEMIDQYSSEQTASNDKSETGVANQI